VQKSKNDTTFVGKGIYSVSEAARLTGVSTGCIRRWLKGYQFRTNTGKHASPPVWSSDYPEIGGKLALSFLDLVEIRFVNAFLKEGVSWPTLRKAAIKAREIVENKHPFCTQKFVTDGREIFIELYEKENERSLVEITKSQRYFEKVIRPYLKNLEFIADEPIQWWPIGKRRQVLIDPKRSFGNPIVPKWGIPTSVLFQAFNATGSAKEVANWYETDIKSVQDAVLFEKRLKERNLAA